MTELEKERIKIEARSQIDNATQSHEIAIKKLNKQHKDADNLRFREDFAKKMHPGDNPLAVERRRKFLEAQERIK